MEKNIKSEGIERVIKVLSSIAIPAVIAYFGWQIEQKISSNNLKKEYVELSISILTSEKEIEPSIRDWAIDILQDNSPVNLSPTAIAELTDGAILFTKETANESFENEQYDQALYYFNELKKEEPENPHYHSKTAYALYKQGHLKKAIVNYDKAIDLEPDNSQFYFLRSLVFWKQGKVEKTRKDLTKTIRLNPNQHAAYNNLGLYFINQNNTKKACDNFLKAVELGNSNAKINLNKYCEKNMAND